MDWDVFASALLLRLVYQVELPVHQVLKVHFPQYLDPLDALAFPAFDHHPQHLRGW